MNPSCLLPPELMHMATLSCHWAKPPAIHTSPTPFDGARRTLGPSHTACSTLEDLQDTMSWQSESHSPQNSIYFDPFDPPDHTPDLSSTPFSCASSDSLGTTHPLHPVPDLSGSSYVPDLDLFGHSLGVLQHPLDPHSLSHSPFSWFNSFSEQPFIIHSPKPIFAYKTFQFDLDCIQPSQTDGHDISRDSVPRGRKRCRDDEETLEDVSQSKKRRMSQDIQEIPPLFPEPSCPTAWRINTFEDDACTPEDLSSMDMFFDTIYGDDASWSNISCN